MSSVSKKTMLKNYEYLLSLPIVEKLNKKYSNLKRENKALRSIITHLGETVKPREIIDLTSDTSSCDSVDLSPPLEIIGKNIVIVKQEVISDQSDEEHIVYDIEECSTGSQVNDIVVKKEEEEEEESCARG